MPGTTGTTGVGAGAGIMPSSLLVGTGTTGTGTTGAELGVGMMSSGLLVGA